VRYLRVEPSGKVLVEDGDLNEALIAADLTASLDCVDGTVWYSGTSSGAFNWQAQRLLRDRLMPEDRVMGDVIVTGPVQTMQGEVAATEVGTETMTKVMERYEQHRG
jgi:hypothetical protein